MLLFGCTVVKKHFGSDTLHINGIYAYYRGNSCRFISAFSRDRINGPYFCYILLLVEALLFLEITGRGIALHLLSPLVCRVQPHLRFACGRRDFHFREYLCFCKDGKLMLNHNI